MKLLSPKQVSETSQKEVDLEIIRIQEYNKAADAARKNLVQAEYEFNNALARQRETWSLEAQKHSEVVGEMTKELGQLEDRKQKALEPLEHLKQKTEQQFLEAEELVKTLKKRTEENDDLTLHLQDKLDEVGQRELNVRTEERRLMARALNVQAEEERIQSMNKSLSEAVESLRIERINTINELDQKSKEIIMERQSLASFKESLDRRSAYLEKWEIRLKDERATLHRIYKREGSVSPYEGQDLRAKL